MTSFAENSSPRKTSTRKLVHKKFKRRSPIRKNIDITTVTAREQFAYPRNILNLDASPSLDEIQVEKNTLTARPSFYELMSVGDNNKSQKSSESKLGRSYINKLL